MVFKVLDSVEVISLKFSSLQTVGLGPRKEEGPENNRSPVIQQLSPSLPYTETKGPSHG